MYIWKKKTKVIFKKINPTEKPPQNNKKPNAIQRSFPASVYVYGYPKLK